MNLVYAFLLFCAAQSLAWLQIFSSYVPALARVHWLVIVATVGTCAGIGFRFATAAVIEATDDAWTARVLAFAAGQLCFALLTWAFLGQGIDKRTALALFFSLCAVLAKVL